MFKKIIITICLSVLPFMVVLLGGVGIGEEPDAQAKVAASADVDTQIRREVLEELSEDLEEFDEIVAPVRPGAHVGLVGYTSQTVAWEIR